MSAVARVLARPAGRHADFVLCPEDGYWFRPLYTEGKCPLCGGVVPGGEPELPRLLRIDRFALGVAALALASLGMTVLVLVMAFRG